MSPRSTPKFRITQDTVAFLEAADALLRDTSVDTTSLHEQAQQYLHVFDSPGCEVYDALSAEWADSLPALALRQEEVTTRGFMHAMYEIARELDLQVGARYVSAAICACARMLDDVHELQRERLAEELRALAFDVWFLQLWHPFEVCDPFVRLSFGVGEHTAHEVMVRDVQPRIVTGAVARDGVYQCLYGVPAINPELLQVVPIFQRSLAESNALPVSSDGDSSDSNSTTGPANSDGRLASDLLTLYLLRSFCELDLHVPVAADSPRNCFVLDPPTHRAFRQFRWTLRPTQVPHTYTVKTYGPPGKYWRGSNETVAFVDAHHDAPEHPDPDIVRAHAVVGSILYFSGLGAAIGQTGDVGMEREHANGHRQSKALALRLCHKGGAWTHAHVAKLGKLFGHRRSEPRETQT